MPYKVLLFIFFKLFSYISSTVHYANNIHFSKFFYNYVKHEIVIYAHIPFWTRLLVPKVSQKYTPLLFSSRTLQEKCSELSSS